VREATEQNTDLHNGALNRFIICNVGRDFNPDFHPAIEVVGGQVYIIRQARMSTIATLEKRVGTKLCGIAGKERCNATE